MTREFSIPHVGLKKGVHNFDFHLDKRFFEEFEDSPILAGDVTVSLKLDKKETFFKLTFEVTGTIETECDKCLEALDQSIKGEFDMYVKFREENEEVEEDSDLIYLLNTDSHLDVHHLIYELVVVSLPIRRVHEKDASGQFGCNAEVLKKLNELNSDPEEIHEDPRWDALKNIKHN